MNKLGIWAIAIAGAFVIGILSANPVVDAVGGWQAAIAGQEVRLSELEEIVFNLPITIASKAAVDVNVFWGLETSIGNDFFSVTPVIIPSGTIIGYDLEIIDIDTLSVDTRLYLDGSPTSLVCTVPAGQLSCSATGSVVVTGLSEVAMKNEGPVGVPGNTGLLRDPTVILTTQ